ncbi:hypothetical protein [Halosimplex sp. J119]
MAVEQRDAFDLLLVALAVVLVVGPPISASDPVSRVAAALAAVTSLDPIAYLVVLGVAGVLFMAYALLYVPAQSGQ